MELHICMIQQSYGHESQIGPWLATLQPGQLVSFREPNGAVMTNMKPPQEGRNTGAPSLRGLQGRSATGLNGQAAKEEVSALWRGGWMPENISGVPAGRSVFHLTSPLIGLLARISYRNARHLRVRNCMIGRSSIRKMVHSRRHRQSWGMCIPRHTERRNPERCCQRWTPASDERCCKGTL